MPCGHAPTSEFQSGRGDGVIVYYVTAHGYGHGVRSCEIVNALGATDPGVDLVLVTALPREFLQARLSRPLAATEPGTARATRSGSAAGTGPGFLGLRHEALDVGMVQRDSVVIDESATLLALEDLVDRWDDLVEREATFLDAVRAEVVVADIPGVPCDAAARVGCPSIAVGNFSWNWIYEPYAHADRRWRPALERFVRAYGRCELLLRLPFAEPMAAFPRREDVPLTCVPGTARRDDLARMSGADPRKLWVLLSFTTLDWDDAALDAVAMLREYEFFTALPLRWNRPGLRAISPQDVPFRDLLASCDYVVSKPGYGIVSECVTNRKPLLHAERAGFREYPILREAIEANLAQVLLSAADLYAGRLGPGLARLATMSHPAGSLAGGGAEIAAARILGRRVRERP